MKNIHNAREMHEEIALITKRKYVSNSRVCITNTRVQIIIEDDEIAEYKGDLFEDNRGKK